MKNCIKIAFPAACLLWMALVSTCSAKRQEGKLTPERVMVFAPKFLRASSEYQALVHLVNSTQPAKVELELTGGRDSDREQKFTKSILVQPGETRTLKFELPELPAAEYSLSMNASALDGSWNCTDEESISFNPSRLITLIQTDKAIYKPGQTVLFRVLFLGEALRPASPREEVLVSVSDPQRNIIREWRQLSPYRGLLSLELPLTEDPMLGDYKIQVETGSHKSAKEFTVGEYILPTYEVDIQLPKYVSFEDGRVIAGIRASYTYGKPVSGHVTLTVQPQIRFVQLESQPLQQQQYRARLEAGSADIELDVVKDLSLAKERYNRKIEFFALVEEDYTGRKYNKTKILEVSEHDIKVESLDGDNLMKPGLSRLFRYKVAYQDDTPVEDNGPDLELDYSVNGKLLEVVKVKPVGGVVEHLYEVPRELPSAAGAGKPYQVNYLTVNANYRGKRYNLHDYYADQSKSHQYLQVSLPQLLARNSRGRPRTLSAAVNDDLKVRVRATEGMPQVVCQGLSRGQIVWALSRDAKNQSEFEFEVKLEPRTAPEMTIVCLYVRPENGETVADKLQLPVEGAIRNWVRIAASRPEVKPGQEVEVSIQTKPNSQVGVLGLDQSVLLLKSGNDITQEDVLKELKPAEGDQPSYVWDSRHMVEREAGLIVLSDSANRDKPVFSRLYYDGPSRIILASQAETFLTYPKPKAKSVDQVVIRKDFAETWLWENGTANNEGLISFKKKVPDTITSWVLTGFSMNENFGIGVSNSKSNVRVFRPFFIKLNLPYSLIRGEVVKLQAVIFNYSKRPVSARVVLDNSKGEFEFVEAANNIEDELASNKSSETRDIKIEPENGTPVSFLIRPKRAGSVDIKMVATSEFASDGVLEKLLVKPEGQTQHLNKAMLVSLRPSEQQQASMSRNVSIEVPSNVVPDSQKVFVSVVGDILGPGLSNVDDLLRLPYGCGEQNMINLVPNIVIMNYLKNSNRLKEAQKSRATRNIETGYQRQLKYKRSDGSFSAFGENDANGSVWLTAYVLKTLQQAKSIITVDDKVIGRAANFIAGNSNVDGGIREVGMIHNRGLSSKTGSSAYLTAYAMIALLQKSISRNGETPPLRPLDEVIENGLNKLEHQLESASANENPYELAIITYALQLGKRQKAADRAYEQLWSKARESAELGVWWEDGSGRDSNAKLREDSPDREDFERISTSTSTTIQPPLKPLPNNQKQSEHLFVPDSLSIEMSSLALMSTVLRGELDKALSIVKWLIGNQNSKGGFVSTQDTVLAIEALASFAEANALSKAPLSIDVELLYPRAAGKASSLRRNEIEQLLVSNSNALVNQRTRLPDNITWVQVKATGSGSAVVQVSWQYNLEVSAEQPAFYLNPILDKTSNANYLQLSICTYYKAGERSNMAVVDVELPSGHVADKEALPGLMNMRDVKRVDTANGDTKVLIYLDKVTSEELCLTVPAHRVSKVSNNKPVPVSIYDYYNRQQVARIFYEPQPTSSCDICDPTDGCSELCSTKPKRAEKLISLHEQRKIKLAQLTQPNNVTTRATNASNVTNTTTHPTLPLSPVVRTLVTAARNLY